jgi:hypothetical protein
LSTTLIDDPAIIGQHHGQNISVTIFRNGGVWQDQRFLQQPQTYKRLLPIWESFAVVFESRGGGRDSANINILATRRPYTLLI